MAQTGVLNWPIIKNQWSRRYGSGPAPPQKGGADVQAQANAAIKSATGGSKVAIIGLSLSTTKYASLGVKLSQNLTECLAFLPGELHYRCGEPLIRGWI